MLNFASEDKPFAVDSLSTNHCSNTPVPANGISPFSCVAEDYLQKFSGLSSPTLLEFPSEEFSKYPLQSFFLSSSAFHCKNRVIAAIIVYPARSSHDCSRVQAYLDKSTCSERRYRPQNASPIIVSLPLQAQRVIAAIIVAPACSSHNCSRAQAYLDKSICSERRYSPQNVSPIIVSLPLQPQSHRSDHCSTRLL